MRIFYNNDIRGFGTAEAVHQAVAWRAESSADHGNQFRSSRAIGLFRGDAAELQRIPPEPKNRGLADEHYPFGALIRLARTMRH
jgi:hypothetical protein